MSRVQPGMSEHRGLADRIKTLEAQVARLSRARTMQSTSLDGGTFRVKNGGTIEILDGSGNVIHTFDVNGMTVFESDGSTLMELDGTGIVLNDGSGTKLIDLTTAGLKAYETDGSTLVHLDGSKLRFNRADGTRQLEITPADGLIIYAANGTTEKVVLDSTGLDVDGGAVIATYTDVKEDDDGGTVTITDTMTEYANADFVLPSWVETAKVLAIARTQSANFTGGAKNILSSCRINDVDDGQAETTVTNGNTGAIVHIDEATIDTSVSGSTVQISAYARHNGSSPGDDMSSLVSVWGLIIGYAT